MNQELLEEARTLAIQLKELKAKEMEVRKGIAFELGKDLDPGSHDFSLFGFKIKLKLSLNYGLDQDELIDLMGKNLLSQEELECIHTKYSLRMKEYKSAGDTSMLDDVIVVKPAAPSLTITLGE